VPDSLGAVPAPEITLSLLDGRQAAAQAGEFDALHAEVYGAPQADQGNPASTLPDRLAVLFRQPGFVLAEARHGGYLVGYACGMPLRPSTSWWRDLTTPLPGDVTAEHPGRTFAVADLLVRAAWRRQGIGAAVHDLLLSGRTEERATLTVLTTAGPAQHALRGWGWHKVARTREARPGSPVYDVLLREPPR
jgi:GNAT superfamily N-acetyltransferase